VPCGVTGTIGSHVFRTDHDRVQFLLEFVNNYVNLDNFVFHSYSNLPTEGTTIELINLQFDDSSQTALTDTSLVTAPDVTRWQQPYGFDVTGYDENGSGFHAPGIVEQMPLGTAAYPIPGPPGPPGPEGPRPDQRGRKGPRADGTGITRTKWARKALRALRFPKDQWTRKAKGSSPVACSCFRQERLLRRGRSSRRSVSTRRMARAERSASMCTEGFSDSKIRMK
jgi:hypothetical protein